ncbi:hypothetical protein AB205_0028280 [Aquarana catesbeiana]|uniref:Uncharacterized protein n=1 Tax=Aquarana catesbeiana TaxID=8400 RepID=A0A2G9Q4A4_AQUCT|nr:hypothetical protein AB205_0028280 [Aquarana catesbeiana]
MQTRFCVRRGHSAAVFTSGALVWDTRTPFLLGVPHRCSSVYYRGGLYL